MTLPNEDDKNKLYRHLRGAAESGWDFSSKHFDNGGKNTGTFILSKRNTYK
jgi:neutral trehalase